MSAKLMVLYNAPSDPDAFDAYYAENHLPLVRAVPGLTSAEASSGPVGTPEGPAGYYKISTYTWGSMAELQQGLASPEGAAAADDLRNFATGGASLLIFEDGPV